MIPKRNPAVAWRVEKPAHRKAWEMARNDEDFEEVGVLTLMVGQGIHQLNLVGAEIWSRVDGERSVAAIAAEVAELFGWQDEGAEVEEAVRAFLDGFAEKGWVILPAEGEGGKA
jgi:GeoRSP system PqqD family protein